MSERSGVTKRRGGTVNLNIVAPRKVKQEEEPKLAEVGEGTWTVDELKNVGTARTDADIVPTELDTPGARAELLAEYVKHATPGGETIRLDLLHEGTKGLIDTDAPKDHTWQQ